MVAGFAEALAVGTGGWAIVVPGDDVVVVADGRVAVRGSAGVVPYLDEPAKSRREEPGFGVHCDQFAISGGGVEPAKPNLKFGIVRRVHRSRICHQFALEGFSGPFAGDDAVAGEAGGFAVSLEHGGSVMTS